MLMLTLLKWHLNINNNSLNIMDSYHFNVLWIHTWDDNVNNIGICLSSTLDEMSSLSRAAIEICQDKQEMRYLWYVMMVRHIVDMMDDESDSGDDMMGHDDRVLR